MWKSFGRGGQATDDNIIQRMRTVRWITKDTETQKEYVKLFYFVLSKLLRERA